MLASPSSHCCPGKVNPHPCGVYGSIGKGEGTTCYFSQVPLNFWAFTCPWYDSRLSKQHSSHNLVPFLGQLMGGNVLVMLGVLFWSMWLWWFSAQINTLSQFVYQPLWIWLTWEMILNGLTNWVSEPARPKAKELHQGMWPLDSWRAENSSLFPAYSTAPGTLEKLSAHLFRQDTL